MNNKYDDQWFELFDAQYPMTETISVWSYESFIHGVANGGVEMTNGLFLETQCYFDDGIGGAVYQVVENKK